MEIERLSNGHGQSGRHGHGLPRSFSNSYGTTSSNDDGVAIERSELGELKEEEIIWGDMELDIGVQPPAVQKNKIDMDITESDDGNHGAVAPKAKRSSLLTMEIKRASAVSSSARSMRSLSINDERKVWLC